MSTVGSDHRSEQRRLSLHNVGHSASSPPVGAPLLPSLERLAHGAHHHGSGSSLPRPSPLGRRPDLIAGTDRWRRESLPSIQRLADLPRPAPSPAPQAPSTPPHHPTDAQDAMLRRHSIHTTTLASSSNGGVLPRPDAPYSRTPELRESHKLAERRRRKEMKELFDDLLNVLPIEKGVKTSKWEILSKAVDYIGDLRQRQDVFARERELLLKEKAAFQNGRDGP